MLTLNEFLHRRLWRYRSSLLTFPARLAPSRPCKLQTTNETKQHSTPPRIPETLVTLIGGEMIFLGAKCEVF